MRCPPVPDSVCAVCRFSVQPSRATLAPPGRTWRRGSMWRISVPQEGQPQGVRAAGITGRRRFLRGSLLAGVGALGVAAVGSIVRLLDSMDQPLEADALHVAAHAIPRPGADPLYFPNERFYL